MRKDRIASCLKLALPILLLLLTGLNQPAHGQAAGAAAETAPRDENHLAAQKLADEAEQLYAKGTAESRRTAIEKYQKARALFRASGDTKQEADVLSNIGAVYQSLGEKQKALEFFVQALPLRRAAGDRQGEAVTLNNFGVAYRSLGEMQKALECYHQSLSIIRSLGDRENEASTLNNLGAVYRALGEMQKALDVYAEALPLWQTLENLRGEAVTLSNLGNVYRSLGELDKSLEFYNRSLARARAARDRRIEATTINNIGTAYRDLGNRQKALDFFNQALELQQLVGDRRGEVTAITNLAGVSASLGERAKALEFYGQALKLWRAVGDRSGEAGVLHSTGEVFYNAGEKEKALGFFKEALSLRRSVLDQTGEAATLYEIARIERDSARLSEARREIEAALAIVENLRAKITSPDLRASYFSTVQQYYDFYIALLMQSHEQYDTSGYDVEAFGASERARARSLLELLEEARADIRQGVDAQLLRRERALQDLLNAKAERQTRLLSGKHTQAEAAEMTQELSGIINEYMQVQARIKQASPRYATLTQPPILTLKEIQADALDPDTMLLEYKLGEQRSYLWAVTRTSFRSFALPKRAEIEAEARQVYELLTARNRHPAGETPLDRQARLRQADEAYPAAAANLSRMLLGPLASLRGAKRLLIVGDGALQYIPFAALPDLASHTGATKSLPALPLIVNYEIVHLPSISVISEIRRERRKAHGAPQMTIAVLADPVFDKDDMRVRKAQAGAARKNLESRRAGEVKQPLKPLASPSGVTEIERALVEAGVMEDKVVTPRLLLSRREAQAILAYAPPGKSMAALNFAASRATATGGQLARYRFVHFATHGLLNSQHPELSGIVLSLVDEHGQTQDGFLRLNEIYNLKLSAELVVLSACQTGLGKEIKGEGLIGLTRGFMYAGAERVAASLWKVDDAATAELMTRFYRGVLREGKTPAAAMRAAQVELSQQQSWQTPYYWAAFILQGEWK
jgi:CHAT domain-containing protein/Flp pilus assembly protein TadD